MLQTSLLTTFPHSITSMTEFNTVQWFSDTIISASSFATPPTRQLTVNLSLLFSTAPNLVRFHFVTPETMEIGDFHRESRAEGRGEKIGGRARDGTSGRMDRWKGESFTS